MIILSMTRNILNTNLAKSNAPNELNNGAGRLKGNIKAKNTSATINKRDMATINARFSLRKVTHIL